MLKSTLMKRILLLTTILFVTLQSFGQSSVCSNGDEPIAINQAITEIPIFIATNGPDDLSFNPLVAVHINLNHNWISDLAISLRSPSGIEYIIVGDEDNNFGGCSGGLPGMFDLQIVPGQFNPITAGSSYAFINPTGIFEGDYTVFCPMWDFNIFQAPVAPNCDLNDFNIGEVSGTWTLRVACVCNSELESDFIVNNWSLEFLNQDQIECDASVCDNYNTNLELETTELTKCTTGSFPQPITIAVSELFSPFEHSAALLYVENEVIQNVEEIGVGINYYPGESFPFYTEPAYLSSATELYLYTSPIEFYYYAYEFMGMTIDQARQTEEITEYCAEISTASVILHEGIIPDTVVYSMCEGGCVDIHNLTFCSTGTFSVLIPPEEGNCSILEIAEIINFPQQIGEAQNREVCLNESIILAADVDAPLCKWTFSDGNVIETEGSEVEFTVSGIFEYLTVTASVPSFTTETHCGYEQMFTLYPEVCESMNIELNSLNTETICFPGNISFDDSCEDSRYDFNLSISESGDCLIINPDEFDCETVCLEYNNYENIPHTVTLDICAVEMLLSAPIEKDKSFNISSYSISKTGRHARNETNFSKNSNGEFTQALLEENQVEISPNPSSDFIKLNWKEAENRMISIMNINGINLLQLKSIEASIKLDVSHLEEGVYFVQIEEKGEIVTKRIVIF